MKTWQIILLVLACIAGFALQAALLWFVVFDNELTGSVSPDLLTVVATR